MEIRQFYYSTGQQFNRPREPLPKTDTARTHHHNAEKERQTEVKTMLYLFCNSLTAHVREEWDEEEDDE